MNSLDCLQKGVQNNAKGSHLDGITRYKNEGPGYRNGAGMRYPVSPGLITLYTGSTEKSMPITSIIPCPYKYIIIYAHMKIFLLFLLLFYLLLGLSFLRSTLDLLTMKNCSRLAGPAPLLLAFKGPNTSEHPTLAT